MSWNKAKCNDNEKDVASEINRAVNRLLGVKGHPWLFGDPGFYCRCQVTHNSGHDFDVFVHPSGVRIAVGEHKQDGIIRHLDEIYLPPSKVKFLTSGFVYEGSRDCYIVRKDVTGLLTWKSIYQVDMLDIAKLIAAEARKIQRKKPRGATKLTRP